MHVHAAPTGKGSRTTTVLWISMVATLAYVALTLFAGLRAHSLALLSEAGHNVSDFLALALSFVAVYFQTRPPTHQKTFGYQRAGVMAAFLNASTLVLISLLTVYDPRTLASNALPMHRGTHAPNSGTRL